MPAGQFCAGGRTPRACNGRAQSSSTVLCSPPHRGPTPPGHRVLCNVARSECSTASPKLCRDRANNHMRWRMGQQSTTSCGNCVSGAHFLPLWSRLHQGLAKLSGVLGPLLVFFSPPPWPVCAACAARPRMSTTLCAARAQVVGSGGCLSLLLLSRRCRGGWFPSFFSLCRHEFVFWTHLCRECMPCAPIFPLPFLPFPFIVVRVGVALSLALATSSMCSPWFCFSHQTYLCSQGARLLGGLQTFLLWLLFPLSTARGGVQGVQTWCVNFLPPRVFLCFL